MSVPCWGVQGFLTKSCQDTPLLTVGILPTNFIALPRPRRQ